MLVFGIRFVNPCETGTNGNPLEQAFRCHRAVLPVGYELRKNKGGLSWML